MTDEGGDPACWLDQVCDACGRMVEGDLEAHRCRPTDETPVRRDGER